MARLGVRSRCLLLAAAVVSAALPAARAQDRIPDLQAQFNRENDHVRKVKALAKLGDAQLDFMRRSADNGDYPPALKNLQDYRDEIRSTLNLLKSTGVDAERHPGGFKQLQIQLRKSLRELDQFILPLPDEQHDAFDAVRKDLLGVEKELIDLLFPRQPGKNPGAEKPKG